MVVMEEDFLKACAGHQVIRDRDKARAGCWESVPNLNIARSSPRF